SFHNGELQILSSYNCNFGNPDYLKGFLSYGLQNYPARRYMVVIKDHGSGWRKRVKKDLSRDICFDEVYGDDSLTISELRSALYYMKVLLGRKIDLLFLDACLMGTIEVDYDLKDLANYLVSSEAIGWGGNTRWDVLFNQLVSYPTISADGLGVLTAQTYFNSYIEPITIMVKDLSKIDDIAKAIYNFAHYLRNYIGTIYENTIINLRNQTQSFAPYEGGPNEYIDLYQFSELIRTQSGIIDSNLINSILDLQRIIKASLIYCEDSGYIEGAINGYSIWFPNTYNYYLLGESKYENLLFTNVQLGKEWQIFLEEILSP
ncbi:MAG: clostripain-related cysteine peptidase, partial [bacterium]|nr:clostripain-related cysteine peptidase [bacterium]